MSVDPQDRDRLTRNMLLLNAGLRRVAEKHDRAVFLAEEDPETFGGGHYVFYPTGDRNARFVIEEEYTGTDWSDPDRLPTSWSWEAQRYARTSDGSHVWGYERYGEVPSERYEELLTQADQWVRRIEHRAAGAEQFRAPERRQQPPAPRL